ncbi:MAG: (Fe-S)-binding protein [Desulfarculus sp.]|nr:(Fe-S)-binding protein [Desulfarculus sp.]
MRLLSRVATVVIPPQGCCGLAAVGAGLTPVARDRLAANLRTWASARVDKIVTTCGSCAHALAKELPRLLDTPQAAALAGSVLEISQVLVEHPRLLAGLGGESRPVAVHDPCHLKISLKVHEEPRQMLRRAGLDLVEMAQADACCGGGGLFAVNQPGYSQEILGPRVQDFTRSGAGVLATSCGGCHLQWRAGLPAGRQVVHPLELLTVPQS